MQQPKITDSQRHCFYAASIIGLRFLDAGEPSPRRFGADADARWESFRGSLDWSDRLDLLIRDAVVRWQAAFSPAQVFQIQGLAEDEAFGPDWVSLPSTTAQSLWQAAWPGDQTQPLFQQTLDAWHQSPQVTAMPTLDPTTRYVAAGISALMTLAKGFAQNNSLSWSDQVLVVAQAPAERHLAGLMAPFLGASAATRLIAPGHLQVQGIASLQLPPDAVVLVSDDADPIARECLASKRWEH